MTRLQFGRLGLSLVLALAANGPLRAASPALSLILPRGVQRGQEHVLSFRGSRLADAQEILFYDDGFEVQKIEAEGANQVKVTVKVAPDCRLGEHVAQVRTASGISDYRTLYVGHLPTLAEKEPNNDRRTPQAIDLNVTVTGVMASEDVDCYAIDMKQGQRLAVEIEGIRLGTALLDTSLTILGPDGEPLLETDDTPLVGLDSASSILASEDGTYVVLIRDSSYAGGGSYYYRAHIGTFPRPLNIYPAGGKLGEEVEVRFIGDAAGSFTETVSLPAEPSAFSAQRSEEFGVFANDEGGLAPSANTFRLSAYGNVLEQEPNDSAAAATPAEVPMAFNGIIEKEGDIDYFKFTAKKDQQFDVECYARRIHSGLDPVMYIYQDDGKRIVSDDDARRPDCYVRFKAPKDGEYTLRVHDHLRRGQPDFVYRVEFSAVAAELTLGIPRLIRYSQYRQQIVVPRGNRFATLITASRRNFSGDLALDGHDLPAGMRLVSEPMPSNMNTMPAVFEADEDAPIAGKLVDFTARPTDEAKEVVGHFSNRADLVRGRPGQSIYRHRDVSRLAVAVVESVPFRLEIVEPKASILRNGSMQLKVVAHREGGFDKAITVEFPFRPPGIGASRRVTIAANKNEILYPLSANKSAQIRKWKIYVVGSADIDGAAWVSSQLATLDVAAQPVTASMKRAACDQGEVAEIICTLNHVAPFEGQAKAQLVGLPSKVTAPVLEFTKDTKQLVFEVKTDPKSPVRRHRNIFCQITVMRDGEPMVSRAGTVELQINTPLPNAGKVQVVKKPTEKPLSRLEQLRLAAQQNK